MTFKDMLDIVEIRTKVVSLCTLMVAIAYVFCQSGTVNPVLLGLLVLAALLVDMGTTGFNTWFDYWQGTDSLSWNMEPAKVLVHKGVNPSQALLVSVLCYALALVPGILIAIWVGPWVVFWGAGCMVVGFCYTGGPWPISRGPAGEFFAGGFLGGVLFLISIRILGVGWTNGHILAALPLTCWIGAILAFNNLCDREGDGLVGRRTIAVLAGPKAGKAYAWTWLYAGVAILVGLPLAGGTGWYLSLAGVAGALATLPVCRRMEQGGYNHATKGPVMQGILRIFLTLAAAETAGLLACRFLPRIG